MRALVTVGVLATAAIALATPKQSGVRLSPPPPPIDPHALPGWSLYDRFCLACHGAYGDGLGPAAPFTWGRPRNFVRGDYEWRSTPTGQPPTDDDLRTTIRYGANGTSMPAFGEVLTTDEVDRVIAVIKAFEPGAVPVGTLFVLGPPRPRDVARGAFLWAQLGCDKCHGERGKGDGPSAKAMAEPPYDLTTEPLRRPRAPTDSPRQAAALSIATGMAGTPMPGFAGAVSDADLWALADHVIALGAHAARRDRSALDADEIATQKVAIGTWPGNDLVEARAFGQPLQPQGTPPASLAPAEASLSSRQCGRCHAKQIREWQGSLHAAAASPGWVAQLATHGTPGTCPRCHTPLAEQQTDLELRGEGVTCAACHVRAWVRQGPPNVAPSLLAVPGYPLVELPLYERADFCLPCHQLPPASAVNRKPLLNTYKEWLEGPYARRGVQCQHCHMPNREHAWLGVHDRETVRQAFHLEASAHRNDGAITVVAELANIGAGHYLPTTTTPAIWLRIELLDAHGGEIAHSELRIGRDVWFDGTWHERSDTRIPPGEHVTMARAWRAPAATTARITVEVAPDAYYEGLYEQLLAGKPAERALYEAALTRARKSHYVAEQRDVALSSTR